MYDLEPWDVSEPGLRVLGMKGTAAESPARGAAKDHRHRDAPTVVALGGEIDNLIEGAGNEVGELKLDDGPEALDAAPQAAPTKPDSEIGVSMTRSSPNSSRKPFVIRKAPPKTPMSSPMRKTVGSAAHLLTEGVADGIYVRYDRHLDVSQGAKSPWVTVLGSG